MIAFYFLTGRAQAARSNAVDLAIIQDEESVFNLRLTRVECRSERCTVKARYGVRPEGWHPCPCRAPTFR